MKITIDGRLWGLENAGLGRYLINLVKGLEFDKKNSYSILLRKKYFNEITLPKNWTKVLADFKHYSLTEQLKLPGIISETKPDIVHFPHFNVPILFKGKFVVTIHDTLMHRQKGFEATTLTPAMYLVKRLGYRVAFDYAASKAKAVIVPSASVRTDLCSKYTKIEDKTYVINEGVDNIIGDEKTSLMDGSKYFIYAGNAYPHKNLKTLFKAIILLNKNYTHKIKLAIASSRNVFTEQLKLSIDKFEANDIIKLLGFVPDKNLGYLFRNSEGFVFPSLSEGFGLPGLEAMNAGTIVLASDIPVFREIYKEYALYFNPNNPDSIAKSMMNVLEMNKNLKNKKIEAAKEFVKKYSWEEMARKTLKLYEKI